MADVALAIVDFSGNSEDLERTLTQGRVDFASFRSVCLVSPWIREKPGFDVKSVDTSYFDLFPRLDELVANCEAQFTLFLNSGAVLMRPLDLPKNWPNRRIVLPRAIDCSTVAPSPIWDRAETIKNSLFPLHPPCFLARNDWMREDDSSFRHFLSYRPWSLWLQALEREPGPLQLEEPSCIIPSPEEPALSHLNRAWLEENNPDLLPELRDAGEEWDILKHDLVNRVASANLAFFQENVAYYAAVTQTGIRR